MQNFWQKMHPYSHDWWFVGLFTAVIIVGGVSLVARHHNPDTTSMPLLLVALFSLSNTIFAFFALPRDALLAYMFLATSLILMIILFFFYQSVAGAV